MTVANDGKSITTPKFPQNAVMSNDNRKMFAFKEKGKAYHAENLNRHIGICLQIDGKLIVGGLKCDKGLLLDDGRFYLIELKGKNYKHAYEQVCATKDWLGKTMPYCNYKFKFYPRIVAKGYPKSKTELQNIKILAAKKFGKGRLEKFENGCLDKIL